MVYVQWTNDIGVLGFSYFTYNLITMVYVQWTNDIGFLGFSYFPYNLITMIHVWWTNDIEFLNTTHTFLTLTFTPEHASIHLDARNGRPSWMQSRVALGKYENHASKAIMRGAQEVCPFLPPWGEEGKCMARICVHRGEVKLKSCWIVLFFSFRFAFWY